MKEIKALINYKDNKLNKNIKIGDNLIELYKKANIELDEERIKTLLNGNKSSNYKPFIETREWKDTEELKVVNVMENEEGITITTEFIDNNDASNSEEKPKARNKRSKK